MCICLFIHIHICQTYVKYIKVYHNKQFDLGSHRTLKTMIYSVEHTNNTKVHVRKYRFPEIHLSQQIDI